jgi:type IV pilus assembly protein PilB
MAAKKRLGDVLIEAGLINETQLSAALQSQRTWGGKLGSTLVRMGFTREEDILRVLSKQLALPAVDFKKVAVSQKAISVLALRLAEKYNVIPVAVREDQGKKEMVLVMSDPLNLDTISEIEFQTGYRVRPAIATDSAIARAIGFYYKSETAPGAGPAPTVGLSQVDDEPMVLVSQDRPEAQTTDITIESIKTDDLLKLLLRVLARKGVVSRADIMAELHRKKG